MLCRQCQQLRQKYLKHTCEGREEGSQAWVRPAGAAACTARCNREGVGTPHGLCGPRGLLSSPTRGVAGFFGRLHSTAHAGLLVCSGHANSPPQF